MDPASAFVPVEAAVSRFGMKSRDHLRVRRYPERDTWRSYSDAANVFPAVRRALGSDRVAALVGHPGTGKSFHALLFGYQEMFGIPGFRRRWIEPESRSFYALASALRADTVLKGQWAEDSMLRGLPGLWSGQRALWIVDDMQDAPGLCAELLAEFRSRELGELEQRLLFVGHGLPPELSGVSRIALPLRATVIEASLRVGGHQVLSPETLERLERDGRVGVREILEHVRMIELSGGSRAIDIEEIRNSTLTRRLEKLSPSEHQFLIRLAHLRFLGLFGFLPTTAAAVGDLAHLVELGWLEPPREGGSTLNFLDDEYARALMVRELSDDPTTTRFLEPLSKYVAENPGALVQVLLGLGRLTVPDLEGWVGRPCRSATGSLLDDFLRDSSREIERALQEAEPSLSAGVELMEALARTSASRGLREAAMRRWHARLARIAEAGTFEEWMSIGRIARAAGDASILPQWRRRARSRPFMIWLGAEGAGYRGTLVELLRQLDGPSGASPEEHVHPWTGRDLASWLLAAGEENFWSMARFVAARSIDRLQLAMPYVPDQVLVRGILGAPHVVQEVLAEPEGEPDPMFTQLILARFRTAMREAVLPAAVTTRWRRFRDARAALQLWPDLGAAALLHTDAFRARLADDFGNVGPSRIMQLCADVRETQDGPTILAARDAIEHQARLVPDQWQKWLRALFMLDREAMRRVVEEYLSRPEGPLVTPEDPRLFWFLWMCGCAHWPASTGHLEPIATLVRRELLERPEWDWNDVACHGLLEVFSPAEGEAGFALDGSRLPDFLPAFSERAVIAASSYAVARDALASPRREEILAHLAALLGEMRAAAAWRNSFLPPTHFQVLEFIMACTASALRERGEGALAESFASVKFR